MTSDSERASRATQSDVLLGGIGGPADLRGPSAAQSEPVAEKLRAFLIDRLSRNGGQVKACGLDADGTEVPVHAEMQALAINRFDAVPLRQQEVGAQ